MISGQFDALIVGDGERYRALLAVAEAIVSLRDLPALFCEMASRLRQVMRFDYLALALHESMRNTLRPDVLAPADPNLPSVGTEFPVEEWPAGLVFQTQRPLIMSNVDEQTRWPLWVARVRPTGIQSTTTRCRLGTLMFAWPTGENELFPLTLRE